MESDTVVVHAPVHGWVTEPPSGGLVLVRPLAGGEPVRVPVDQLDAASLPQVLDMARRLPP